MKKYTIYDSIKDLKKEKDLIQGHWTDQVSITYQSVLDSYTNKAQKLEKELAQFTHEINWLETVCDTIEAAEQSQKRKVYAKRL